MTEQATARELATERVELRMTPTMRGAITNAADDADASLTEWILDACEQRLSREYDTPHPLHDVVVAAIADAQRALQDARHKVTASAPKKPKRRGDD